MARGSRAAHLDGSSSLFHEMRSSRDPSFLDRSPEPHSRSQRNVMSCNATQRNVTSFLGQRSLSPGAASAAPSGRSASRRGARRTRRRAGRRAWCLSPRPRAGRRRTARGTDRVREEIMRRHRHTRAHASDPHTSQNVTHARECTTHKGVHTTQHNTHGGRSAGIVRRSRAGEAVAPPPPPRGSGRGPDRRFALRSRRQVTPLALYDEWRGWEVMAPCDDL